LFLFINSCKKNEETDSVFVRLPTVTTSSISEIGLTSAKCGGSVVSDGGGDISEKGICWAVIENPTILDNKIISSSIEKSFSCNLTDLKIGGRYYVRAFATNSAGTSYGKEQTFRTTILISGFSDSRDYNSYRTVTLGDQVWMAENLRYLPFVVANKVSLTVPYIYVYDNMDTIVSNVKLKDNYITYGSLYNWTAACNACPEGWRLPTDNDWDELIEFIGGNSTAGIKLKDTLFWSSASSDKIKTNEYGFSARPGGILQSVYGSYRYIRSNGNWWSASDSSSDISSAYNLNFNANSIRNFYENKDAGLSIRCIKN